MKRARNILLVLLGLTLATPRAGDAGRRPVDRLFVPEASPTAPVETHFASDRPIDKDGVDARTAKYLDAFDVKSDPFEYTLQLLAEEESFRIYRLVFPSPLRTPWPANNVVPAEYYVPRGAGAAKKVPAAVVLDIMDGSAILPRMMARSAAQNGLAALYLPMPYYNARRPPHDEHEQAVREDPTRMADGLRQTVMDVRRARAILGVQPEVDAARIGITGISMGGIMTALAAGVDGQFCRAVPILSGGDLATIVFHAHETRKLRAAFANKGMGRDAAAEALAPVEPLNFAARLGADRCLMINASDDEVIPKETTEKLCEAFGGPQVLWLPAGHYSSLTYFPVMQKTVIDFLRDGARPPRR
jgi:dienelactone hydrolase